MDDNQTPTELSAEDQAAEAAFTEGFEDTTGKNLPSLAEPVTAVVETPKPVEEGALEPKQETPADPYAGLPEPVKEALARIPTLENELRRTTGQVRSLQSAHDRAAAAAAQAAPAEAPRSKAYEQVAETLPEVLQTIDEIVNKRLAERGAATAPAVTEPVTDAGDTRSPDERRLDEGFPQWREIGGSTDFKLWAAAQPDSKTIQTTNDMVTFMGAITRFEKHRTATAAAQDAQRQQAALRTSRIDASVTPTSSAARRPVPSKTEEDAFADGFRSRGG